MRLLHPMFTPFVFLFGALSLQAQEAVVESSEIDQATVAAEEQPAAIAPEAPSAVGPYGLDPDAYILRYNDVQAPVIARKGMVSSQNFLATEIGVDILKRGGNATDASVAVGFALAVVLPRAGNIGGGGFMLVHQDGETVGLDYREAAPKGVRAEDFLTETGEKDRESRFTWAAVGVPGTVAGFWAAWERYGSMPWEELVQPAIDLAENGFPVSEDLSEILKIKKSWLGADPGSLKAFYKADGVPYEVDELMRRPDLARTLRLIAEQGTDPFYKGEIARRIVNSNLRNGGHITLEDLAAYKAIFRPVLKGTYRGYDIAAMPPPSSGGIAIIEMLNIMENFPLPDWGYAAPYVHVLAESMKLAFADRGAHLGDPDYVEVPTERLLSKDYAAELAGKIQLDSVLSLPDTPNANLKESPSTTHYSVVDAMGNAVSNTYTLSSSFGAGLVVPETGILMNNQIHTFSVRAGIEGATGFIASEANKIEPGKRPISSQSPTIVLKDGRPFLVVGSPGGSRIINAVVQIISNVIDQGMNIADATHQRRIHHQWVPDVLEVEPRFNLDTRARLEQLGHKIKQGSTMGSTQSIQVSPPYIFGASDPRRPNALTSGFN